MEEEEKKEAGACHPAHAQHPPPPSHPKERGGEEEGEGNACFDVILAADCCYHDEDNEAFLATASQLLRDGR